MSLGAALHAADLVMCSGREAEEPPTAKGF
jgi:hypothetical protein